MNPVDCPDPRHRGLGIALRLATCPPVRRHEHADAARVPWRLIIGLREALGDAGEGRREVHAVLRKTDEQDRTRT